MQSARQEEGNGSLSSELEYYALHSSSPFPKALFLLGSCVQLDVVLPIHLNAVVADAVRAVLPGDPFRRRGDLPRGRHLRPHHRAQEGRPGRRQGEHQGGHDAHVRGKRDKMQRDRFQVVSTGVQTVFNVKFHPHPHSSRSLTAVRTKPVTLPILRPPFPPPSHPNNLVKSILSLNFMSLPPPFIPLGIE